MIRSYQEYLDYLEADRVALNRSTSLKSYVLDEIWRFQRLMRRVEYLENCGKSQLLRTIYHFKYRSLRIKLGFSIPANVFGPGLSIAHIGTIVVSGNASVGANCRLHTCVNIGQQAGSDETAPTIGNNCYIGPGAKLFGPIIIGDNTAIGANAVVNGSFPSGNVTIGGIPAEVISDRGSESFVRTGLVDSRDRRQTLL
jgi:serine O-acetyltransferase